MPDDFPAIHWLAAYARTHAGLHALPIVQPLAAG